MAKTDKERLATGFWNRIESNQAADYNILLALFSLMQVPRQIGIGCLSDKRVSVEMLAFLAPLVSRWHH